MENKKIPCPFCNKEISVYYQPSIFQYKSSHSAAAGTKTKFYKTKEKYEPLENCPHCGKSKKDIKKALEGDMPTKPKSKEEVRKQLEELGLLDKFEGKKEEK